MPFDKAFDDVYKLVKAVAKAAGAYCEIVDEQIFVESMLERIYNQIAKADIIVSDMTGRNPTVFQRRVRPRPGETGDSTDEGQRRHPI